MLICPLCQQLLQSHHRQWRCCNNHSFDQAKEGYLNLLPVQHKGSKQPGDSPEMMQARRRFLQAGHYLPLVDALKELLFSDGEIETLLDIGCGEGYYSAQLNQHVLKQSYGMDISKQAAKMAAKQHSNVQFLVASNKRLPFATASLAAITRIFAPSDADELARCTKPGGQLLIAAPGPRHLFQLKEMIYPNVREHDDRPQEQQGFERQRTQSIHYKLSLGEADWQELMMMTPFAWRLKESQKNQLKEQQPELEVAFTLHQYRRS